MVPGEYRHHFWWMMRNLVSSALLRDVRKQDPMLVQCTGLKHLLHLSPVSCGMNALPVRLPLFVATQMSELRECHLEESPAGAAGAF
jgi:hypothetical protein